MHASLACPYLLMHASLACPFLRFLTAIWSNAVHATNATSLHASNITFEYAVEVNPVSKLQLTLQRENPMQAGRIDVAPSRLGMADRTIQLSAVCRMGITSIE
jgi:hypothetical protein